MTGTFDDWAKSVKLENKGEHFEKLVELPLSKEKIFYKVRYLYSRISNMTRSGQSTKLKWSDFIAIVSTLPHHRNVVDARIPSAV